MAKTTAIILAAGSGSRMGIKTKKQFIEIEDKPVLYYSLKTFENSSIDEIILVTNEDSIEYCQGEVVDKFGFKKVKKIIAGGKERYNSVYNGLLEVEDSDYVLIHDSARAAICLDIIEDNIKQVQKYRACVTGVLSKDTVKIADEFRFIESTPQRENVWIIQTPQSFEVELIKKAYEYAIAKEIKGLTDDAMVLENYPFETCKIKLLEGDYKNLKITTIEDIEVVKKFLKKI